MKKGWAYSLSPHLAGAVAGTAGVEVSKNIDEKNAAAEVQKNVLSCLAENNRHSAPFFRWDDKVKAAEVSIKVADDVYWVSSLGSVSVLDHDQPKSGGRIIGIGGFFKDAVSGKMQWQGSESLQPIAETVRGCFAKPDYYTRVQSRMYAETKMSY